MSTRNSDLKRAATWLRANHQNYVVPEGMRVAAESSKTCERATARWKAVLVKMLADYRKSGG